MRFPLVINPKTASSSNLHPSFPPHLITSLRLDTIDQLSPLFVDIIQNCHRISSLEVLDFGLDVGFLEEALLLCPAHLKRLAVRSDGFVVMESMVEVVLGSNVATQIQTLSLDIGDIGLEETHSLPWSSFRSILDTCTSLSSISLGNVRVMDVPEYLEETNALHATTVTFPNITSLTLRQCDISGIGRVRLLRMFPNLRNLELVCRDAVFDIENTNANNDSNNAAKGSIESNIKSGNSNDGTEPIPGSEAGVEDHLLCVNLRRVSVRCTNTRSQVDQDGLYRFLIHLPSLETLELMGLGTDSRTLLRIAQEWTRRGVRLRHLHLDFSRRKVLDEGLEMVLRQGCCSKLEILDAWCGPSLLFKFWNQETMQSELPFLETLKGFHLRKDYEALDNQHELEHIMNLTLRQMPKLVDLTIAAKLNDYSVFQGMGREPEVPLPPPDTPMTGIDWSRERPFLQTLAIGFSSDFYSNRMSETPRQVGRRFRFLEDFRFVVNVL
ncbi:hypothetical protein BGZ80_000432 [Entomortierella chlamydospora]|uniref:Uncharacterized protein n=1 Tax=Entomortierella chlamydospora TaxID=101097 RepID=A0A9P6T3L3_9FUNG|nr:hypothetical protein BGZ80_000432 [Entomortierella chlamydospora]